MGRQMSEGDPALANLTVLEMADAPGAAFAASMLADFGAAVVVVEPLEGAPLRRLGGAEVRQVWWPILARNKRSLALDLGHPEAGAVLRRVAGKADLVIFGPRDRDGGPATVSRGLIGDGSPVLSIVPPGWDDPSSWPWGVASELTAAVSGMMALTGEADGPPVEPEFPLAEYIGGVMAAAQALIRLYAARREGRAARFPVFPLHVAVQRMIEWQTAVATAQGRPELRAGNRFPMNAGIANIFTAADGRLVACSAANEAVAARLLEMVGGPALRDDPRFRDHAARERNMDAIYPVIAEWMRGRTADEAVRQGREHDVVIGPIYRTGDLMADPHVAARGDVIRREDADGRQTPMPAPVPKIAGAGADVRRLGPRIGADSESVLSSAGFTANEIARLRDAGVLGRQTQ